MHEEAGWHPLCRQGLCQLCPLEYPGPQSRGISGDRPPRRAETMRCEHACHSAADQA